MPHTAPSPARPARLMRWLWPLAGALLAAIGLAAAWLAWRPVSPSPVPPKVRNGVAFPVYYPAAAQLPPGYTLQSSSFRLAQDGVVVYSIGHSGGQALAVSEETQPAGTAMADFVKNYIPLHATITTSLGQAQIGVYGQAPNLRTVLSLPITKGPWLIITAPAGISQSDLKRIVQALRS